MILQISPDMSRIAFNIHAWGRQMIAWEGLELVIEDAECEPKPLCKRPHVPGSPWVLTGCWPLKWTNMDIANFRAHHLPDYHPVVIPAYGLDNEGRIVFLFLNHPFKMFPFGRYQGSIRLREEPPPQMGIVETLSSMIKEPDPKPIPSEFTNCCDSFPYGADLGPKIPPRPGGVLCPPGPRCPAPRRCVLATFDIDYGPSCSDHLVKDVVVDYVHPTGGVEDGDT